MSTAKDLQNDPFTQGSGLVDVNKALGFVNSEEGIFLVHNNASYSNIKKILTPALESINSTSIGFDKVEFPTKTMPMTSWFAGQLVSGEHTKTTFTIENPTDQPIQISIKPTTISLIKSTQFDGTTKVRQQDQILNKSDAFIPNYVKLSDIKEHKEWDDFFDNNSIPSESSLMILNLNFPFANSASETRTQTEWALAAAFVRQMGNIEFLIRAIGSIVFFTLVLVTGNTMAIAVRERTNELAVLKAIGYSDRFVLGLILAESVLIALLGGALGLSVAYAARRQDITQGLILLYLPAPAVAAGICIALGTGVLAGLLPALGAMRLSVVDALRRV